MTSFLPKLNLITILFSFVKMRKYTIVFKYLVINIFYLRVGNDQLRREKTPGFLFIRDSKILHSENQKTLKHEDDF